MIIAASINYWTSQLVKEKFSQLEKTALSKDRIQSKYFGEILFFDIRKYKIIERGTFLNFWKPTSSLVVIFNNDDYIQFNLDKVSEIGWFDNHMDFLYFFVLYLHRFRYEKLSEEIKESFENTYASFCEKISWEFARNE